MLCNSVEGSCLFCATHNTSPRQLLLSSTVPLPPQSPPPLLIRIACCPMQPTSTMAAAPTIRLFILAAAFPLVSALPYCSLLEVRAVTTITTSDTRFSVGTYTAHGLYQAATATAAPIAPQPSAATPFRSNGVQGGEDEEIVRRTAPAPDFTTAPEIPPGGWRGTWPALGPALKKPVSGGNTPPTGDQSSRTPLGLGLGPVHGLRGGFDVIQPPGKRAEPPEDAVASHSPAPTPHPQRDGSLAEASSAVPPLIEESGVSNAKAATDSRSVDGLGLATALLASPSEAVTPAPATTVQPAAVWSPQVIATSLALIPVILAITVICCLILFMILHCCTPREITHVTNNTFTTKVVRRTPPRDAEKPPPGPARGLPDDHAPVQTVARPERAAEAAVVSQNDGILDPSPSSDLYLPQQYYAPRQHAPASHSVPSTPPQAITAGNWHRGLLGFGSRKSPSIKSSSLLRPSVPPSLLGGPNAETSYVLSQASRRLEDEALSHHQHHPLSTVPASPLSAGPGPGSVFRPPSSPAAEGEWEQGPHPPHGERRTSLTSGLQDTGCGTHTLRNRRKGMRDTWLSNLFVEKAPGTENLVILEQRDGALRGASVGGAVEPEPVQAASETSGPPRRPHHEAPGKPLRRRVSKPPKPSKATLRADVDIQAVEEKMKKKPNPKPHTVPRVKSVQRYSREINPKSAGSVSAEALLLAIPRGQPPISSLGSGDLWGGVGPEIPGGKENTNERHTPIPPLSRHTAFEGPAVADAATRVVKEGQQEARAEPDPAVVPLAPPNNPDGPTDLMAFRARVRLIEEEINRRLQAAVDDQVEQDELCLHMMASLDGTANSPPAMGSRLSSGLLAPGWLLDPDDDRLWGSGRVDSVLINGGTNDGGTDGGGGRLSGSSSQISSAPKTSELGETFMDEGVSTTTLGTVQSID